MAGFRTHITVSTGLGLAYGAAAVSPLGFAPATAVLAAGVTGVGGMLPDLDSDSGVPLRFAGGLMAALSPILLLPRFHHAGFSYDGTLAGMMLVYLLIRYPLVGLFKRFTVHRGMFHSIPAMLIAGLIVYLGYPSRDVLLRMYLGVGVMLGFLSHLVLDEIWAVDFMGVGVRFNKFSGSALKFASASYVATLSTYGILVVLTYVAWSGTPQWASSLPTTVQQIPWPTLQMQAQKAP